MDTGKIKHTDPEKKFRRVLACTSLVGDRVKNRAGDDLGKVDDIMLDLENGRVSYCVLSYGGVLGMGNKLFAVPWQAVSIDEDQKCFILDVDKQRLENAPGFDKNNWPDFADATWASQIHSFYGTQPYTEEEKTRTYRGGGGI